MLSACTSGQKTYYVAYQTATAYVGDSPGAACKYFSDAASVTFTNATEHACSTSAGTFAIVKACDDTPVGTSTGSGGTTSGTVQILFPPFQLDTADGALIAGAILAVWAIGWASRMLIRTLSIDGNSTKESE